ncbi:Protein ELYS [Eufriesea mexicana]|uniref:Protein ELYS n=1 Tax=Eufriesea mexicana TaxID=516756 RepID=A0A310S7C8_9HYME|nr:Protein ELYS [Eufriesea mexicana]
MKELEEVSCEIRNVIDIQHSITKCLSNVERDDGGPSNGSQIYNSSDGVYGGFLNDATYAWLSYGCHLVVLNAKTGESTSSWTFRGKITCVCQFPVQCGELPLLLVGLDNEATRIKDSMGLLCIFDCTSSRVLRAIRMPAGVEQVCIVSGGTEWEEFNDKRPDNILMQMDGIACVVLRNLHHLMIDLQRSTWEVSDLSLIMDEISPAEIEFLTTKDSFHRNNSKHMTCNLLTQRIEKHIGFNREDFESNAFLDEKLTNIIISSTKIGCLISGCLGRVIIWQNDGSVGWISTPVDETMIVTHLALLEPADDPRSFYYLWVVFQDDSFRVPPLLRMFALLFNRKYCNRGTNLYFNLEAEPSLKFEVELDSKDRVVSLSTIERGNNLDQTESECRKGEDSLILISTTNRTLLFDLNQWYKEQMPQTISECKNPNSILACYNTNHQLCNLTNNEIISCAYISRTLQEFPNNSLSSSEELFYPNSLSLEWIELSLAKLTFWFSRGVQAELLREIALTGPIILTQPSEMFHKCLSVGLVPFNTEVSFSSDHNTQRDMLLSLCLEQRWATFLIRCAKEWSDGSAAYMYPNFLKWGIQRASSIKMIADHLCIPLFDQSGNNIGESEVKTLRFCHHQLECLSNVVAKLPFETSSLIKQRRALKRVSMYFQVLLWFYDVGLLPESQNLEEGPLPISLALKIPYPYEKLFAIYKEKRESIKDNNLKDENEKVLFIDELITRECPALNLQWEREAGDVITNGYYPPPSLQSLLRSYLTDCGQIESNEIKYKHQITIYLLMDLAMLLQGSYPGVDQLIKYPSSFKMSPSLIKLTQAFWLLDHEDYHGFLDMITGQLVSDSDVKDWYHKLVLRTLIRNSQHKLALMYLRIKKPPLSSIQEQSTLITLSVEHGLVQSAFHHRPRSHYTQILMCFFHACKNYDKLGDILHLALDSEEEEMFVKFLEDSKSEDIKLLYYLQRCRYMEVNSKNSTTWFNAIASKNTHVDILNAYNATLPDVVKRFSMSINKMNLDTDLESRYPRPMTYNKNLQRTTNIYETVIKKARETYLRGEKSGIPFVTAPCATLKLSNDKINISCVMSPEVVEKSRKRTLEEITHDEENSDLKTLDKTKRRKLLDDGESVLNAAFSTPLVKRKISNNRDTPIETPHSILKIRQLIRNSTSPVGNLQVEIMDNSVLDRERKIPRQIRFNINQSKNNSSLDEVNGGEDFSKLNDSEESKEVFISPVVSEKSLTESAVLSDSSYTCKNVYTARPRPSLRRSHLQTSTESMNESLTKCSRSYINSHLSTSSGNTLHNCLSKDIPQVSTRFISTSSSSVYSPAILSPDSSFETNISLRKFNESNLHSKESVDKDIEEDIIPEVLCNEEQKFLESIKQSNNLELCNSKKLTENMESKYRNGDLSKIKTLEDSSKGHKSNEKEFKDFPNIMNNLSYLESKEQYHWSFCEDQYNKFEHNVEKHVNSQNTEHFDITDDESSHSGDEAVLVFDKIESKEKQELETVPMVVDNIYDASNITDDESDSSVEVIDDVERIAGSGRRDSTDNQSRLLILQKEISQKYKTKEKSIQLDNNNSSYKKARKNSVHNLSECTEQKDIVNTSSLDSESYEVAPRITRSRRASSTTKEINTSPLNSPSKTTAKISRSRRASSLVKEVLIGSVSAVDETIKRAASSGSEGSPGTSSPRKNRGKRASSITKDISIEAESKEAKIPVRRTTRRSVSVQKELPEPVTEPVVKPLVKNSKLSITDLTIKDNETKVQIETKALKTKQFSGGTRKSSTILTKSTKEFETSEQEMKEMKPVEPPRKRGSSMPKESISIVRTRRSSSVAKEIISEESESLLETIKGQVEHIIGSPAVNTRSRRSSIQSIPEELEEILSVPLKERVSTASNKTQTAQNSRQRRAVSVELSQIETRRKLRSTRNKGFFEETIIEEAVGTASSVDNSDLKKVSTKRKHISSETSGQEAEKVIPKPRRNRKPTKQDTKNKEINQFSFSQPEKMDNLPLDEKAIGEVPKYMFSPPQTRSKTMAADHRRWKISSFIPVLREDEKEEEVEDGKETQTIQQRTTEVIKPGHYIRETVNRCRMKFVLPKQSKSTTN